MNAYLDMLHIFSKKRFAYITQGKPRFDAWIKILFVKKSDACKNFWYVTVPDGYPAQYFERKLKL